MELVHQRIYSNAKFHKHKRTDAEVKPQSLARAARKQGQTYLQACFHISPAGLKFDDVTTQSNPQMLLFVILIMQVAIKNII